MSTQPTNVASGKFMVTAALIAIVAIIGYYVMTAPDRRTSGEKIGDAIDQLGDRTPADKLSNAAQKITNP